MYKAIGDEAYFAAVRDALEPLNKAVAEELEAGSTGSTLSSIDFNYMTGLAGVGDFFVYLLSDGKFSMVGGLGYGDDFEQTRAGSRRRAPISHERETRGAL